MSHSVPEEIIPKNKQNGKVKMKTTYMHFEDEIAERKQKTGLTWREILILGLESAEKRMARKTLREVAQTQSQAEILRIHTA